MARRLTAAERRRRQARIIALIVALAMIALFALPLLAVAAPRAGDGVTAADVAHR